MRKKCPIFSRFSQFPAREETPPTFTWALVVFSDRTQIWWLRGLRRGFRHCFAVLHDLKGWIVCEPMCHRMDITLLPPVPRADLALWYRRLGFRVVEVTPRPTPLRVAPVRPMTCVETVKRLLGLRAPGSFTPWQLYRHLIHEKTPRKKILTN